MKATIYHVARRARVSTATVSRFLNGTGPVAAETRHRIWAAFRHLSRRQQEVFALRHVEGFSTAEVAETLDLSTGSAKRHLFRAVQRLRDALQGTP